MNVLDTDTFKERKRYNGKGEAGKYLLYFFKKKKKKDEMVQYVINCSHVCSLNSLWALDH